MAPSSLPEFLTKGADVEVTSEEEGFRGAWYIATVVKPPSSSSTNTKQKTKKKNTKSKKDKVHVEYKTLYADVDHSKPLREFVDVEHVRPPPPLADVGDKFEVYDVVDALYKDGWWTGVITGLVGGSEFSVTFSNPPEELQFECEDLRFHFDWVDGAWERPPKQKIAPCYGSCTQEKIPGLIFGEGKEVEVQPEHREDVWFPAAVVENGSDSLFLVQYMTMKEGTNETEPQSMTVHGRKIRPSPPLLKDRLFNLFEKVEALNDFGWWAGTITRELPDNRYTVFFPGLKRNGEFVSSDIRPRLNWKDGKWWFESSPEEVTLSQENPGVHVVSELDDMYSGSTCRKNTSMNEKQIKDMTSGSPPSNITGENILIDVSGCDQPSYPSSGMRTDQSSLTGCGNCHYTEKKPKKQKKRDGKKIHMLNSRKKPRKAGEECNNDFAKLVENVEQNSGGKKDDVAFMSLELCSLSDSKARKNCMNDGEKCLQLEGGQKQLNYLPMPDKGDQPEAEKSNYNRKRSRSRKVFAGSPEAEMTVQVRNSSNDDIIIKDTLSKVDLQVAPDSILLSTGGLLPAENSLMHVDDCIRLVSAQLDQENDPGSTIGKSCSRMPTDSNDEAKQRTNENKISGISDGPVAKPAKPFYITKEVIDSSDVQNHVLVDRDTMVEQSAELRNIRNELNGQTSSTKDHKTGAVVNEEVDGQSLVHVDGMTSIITTGELDLPFVKSSSIWKIIESMEVFRKMPQKPHFRPLQQFKANVREGFAIGFMACFSSTVEKIACLRFEDPKQKIDDILDSLDDLESHGFGVQVLRDKISEMESIKEKDKKLHEEVEVIYKQIVSCNLEKADQKRGISEITEHVKKLEAIIAKTRSIMEMKDCEIAVLESRRKEVEEARLRSRSLYEGLASTLVDIHHNC